MGFEHSVPRGVAITGVPLVIGSRLSPAGEALLPRPPKRAEIGRCLLKSSSLSVVEENGTMQTRNRGDYTIAGCELVAEGADLRVRC